MLFTVKKENIIEGLQKAAGIIPTRAGAAYLRSLWIKAEGEVLTIKMCIRDSLLSGRLLRKHGNSALCPFP